MEGELRPSRPQGVSPGFRAALVQPSFHSPFPLRFTPLQGWEIPLPLQLLPPALRQEAFGMYVHAAAHSKAEASATAKRRNHP